MASERDLRFAVAYAREDARVANERLISAVRDAFPLDAYIVVPRGRGLVRGYVVGYGPSWSRPMSVRVRLHSNNRFMWVDVSSLIPRLSSDT